MAVCQSCMVFLHYVSSYPAQVRHGIRLCRYSIFYCEHRDFFGCHIRQIRLLEQFNEMAGFRHSLLNDVDNFFYGSRKITLSIFRIRLSVISA